MFYGSRGMKFVFILEIECKAEVKQSLCSPGGAQRVPGS